MVANHKRKHNLKFISDNDNPQGEQLTRKETAVFIAEMLLQLRNMAKSTGLRDLQGILELGYYEAFGHAHRVNPTTEELDYINRLDADVRREEGAG